MSEAFLDNFERRRVELETRMLRMPQAGQVVARWGGPSGIGQQYLHALPTLSTLVEFVSRSPRTAGALRDRLEKAGPTRIRGHEVERCLSCFSLAYLYRAISKRTRDAELASQLLRMATLAMLTPAELEKVDWVTRAFSATLRDGSKDRLAVPNLLLWWLTGSESLARAYEVDLFLEELSKFVAQSLDLALNHQINMAFPW